jgi:hypothetical protein
MKTLLSLLFVSILGATVLPTTQKQITGKDGKTVTVNVSQAVQSWRLVYANGRVLAEFESTGVTQTINSLYCATTKAEVDSQVTALKLTPLAPEKQKAAKAASNAAKPARKTGTAGVR